MILRGFFCLYMTAVRPLRQSYNPNAVTPFPLNEECIKSLEMALLVPTSADYFYNFLENQCEDKDALIYFGMYADLRTYLRMVEDYMDDKVMMKQVDQIYSDYISEQREWNIYIPEDILNELRQKMKEGRVPTQLDESLFNNLYVYTLDILDGYYREFQQTKLFEELIDEVSKQEILYEILRRYNMISS